MKFPLFKTKTKGVSKKLDLTDPKDQKEFFELKAGKEIKKLREYLKDHTFVAYLLGKKNSGKGTYSKMFAEIILPEKIESFSIGDMIRDLDKELANPKKKKELYKFLEKNYRGRFSLEEVIRDLENRDTKTLRPTEVILALVKREMEKRGRKSLFIDGFPRDLDQINFSLFFRDLIGHRDDPDIFILIDVPENVIDERIKWRRICPVCKTSRNLKLLPTSKVEYDKKRKESYLLCEGQKCKEVKMVQKEGDELGIKNIKQRLEIDDKLMDMALSLHGIPKILLRNSVPVKDAPKFVDDYEITPEYEFKWNEKKNKVERKEKNWVVADDEGVPSYSLMPPPVVVSMIKQMVNIFNL
jgi:adenylate kinase family enzyme